MIIPGFLIALLTFPGVIVHEIGHLLFCRLLKVRVHEVCYFRLGNPSGYVVHDSPRSAGGHLLIAFGPLFVNTITGALIGAPVYAATFERGGGSPLHWFLLWLGISIAMHSFPSVGDARSLWHALWTQGSCFTRLLVLPFVALIYLGALGSIFRLDLIYGIAVVMLPALLFGK